MIGTGTERPPCCCWALQWDGQKVAGTTPPAWHCAVQGRWPSGMQHRKCHCHSQQSSVKTPAIQTTLCMYSTVPVKSQSTPYELLVLQWTGGLQGKQQPTAGPFTNRVASLSHNKHASVIGSFGKITAKASTTHHHPVTRAGSVHSGQPVSSDTGPASRSLSNRLISICRSLTVEERKEIKTVNYQELTTSSHTFGASQITLLRWASVC